jgi:hypothetical protein
MTNIEVTLQLNCPKQNDRVSEMSDTGTPTKSSSIKNINSFTILTTLEKITSIYSSILYSGISARISLIYAGK